MGDNGRHEGEEAGDCLTLPLRFYALERLHAAFAGDAVGDGGGGRRAGEGQDDEDQTHSNSNPENGDQAAAHACWFASRVGTPASQERNGAGK
jgi:hypothetical protein